MKDISFYLSLVWSVLHFFPVSVKTTTEPVDVEKAKKLREQELEKAAAAAKAAAESEAIATVRRTLLQLCISYTLNSCSHVPFRRKQLRRKKLLKLPRDANLKQKQQKKPANKRKKPK
jgi:hypothetical protein